MVDSANRNQDAACIIQDCVRSGSSPKFTKPLLGSPFSDTSAPGNQDISIPNGYIADVDKPAIYNDDLLAVKFFWLFAHNLILSLSGKQYAPSCHNVLWHEGAHPALGAPWD
jgi:hypothetical protein